MRKTQARYSLISIRRDEGNNGCTQSGAKGSKTCGMASLATPTRIPAQPCLLRGGRHTQIHDVLEASGFLVSSSRDFWALTLRAIVPGSAL